MHQITWQLQVTAMGRALNTLIMAELNLQCYTEMGETNRKYKKAKSSRMSLGKFQVEKESRQQFNSHKHTMRVQDSGFSQRCCRKIQVFLGVTMNCCVSAYQHWRTVKPSEC
jgi:hypothetical protein